MAKTIYHYTSGNALKSIVENKKLWFSDIRCMNDYGEQKLFLDAIKAKSILAPDELISDDVHSEYNETVTSELDKAHNQTRCFILSCSLSDDSLPMWNYYSKGDQHGGYNIGFDVLNTVKYIYKNFIQKIEGAHLFYGKVFYCNDTSLSDCIENIEKYTMGQFCRIPSVYDAIIKSIDENLYPAMIQSMCNDDEKVKMSKSENKQMFMKQYIEYLEDCKNFDITTNPMKVKRCIDKGSVNDYLNINYFIKTGDFICEKEFRIAILIPGDKIGDIDKQIYKTRYQNGIYIPYLDIEIPQESFVSAKIAPTNFTMGPEENLKEFLLDNKLDINVSKSKITVRY